MNELLLTVHELVALFLTEAEAFGAEDLLLAGIFYAFAGVSVLAAVGVVLCRNIFHSALLLTLTFISVGCLYLYLGAEFLGAVQIMVYGGAVAVLTVLAVMLTRREANGPDSPSNPSRGLLHQATALPVAGGFVVLMGVAVLLTPCEYAVAELGDSVTGLADLMLTKYMLPFEVVAVLLLTAMLGAVVLAKGADEG